MCGDAQQESQDLNLFLAGSKGESPSISLQKTEAEGDVCEKGSWKKPQPKLRDGARVQGVKGAGPEAPKGCRRVRDAPKNSFGVSVGEICFKIEQKKPNHLTFISECLERFSDDHQKLKEYQSQQKKGINHEIKMKSFKATQILGIQLSRKKISQNTGWK